MEDPVVRQAVDNEEAKTDEQFNQLIVTQEALKITISKLQEDG